MKACITVKLPNGSYKIINAEDIEQVFINTNGEKVVFWKDGYGYEVANKQEIIKSLSKKLDIAIEALKWIDKHSSKYDCSWSIEEQLDNVKAQAQEAVYQIEEL